jgi:hypothetical protein
MVPSPVDRDAHLAAELDDTRVRETSRTRRATSPPKLQSSLPAETCSQRAHTGGCGDDCFRRLDRCTLGYRVGDASIALLAGTRRVVATHAIARRTGPASLSGRASRTAGRRPRLARIAGLSRISHRQPHAAGVVEASCVRDIRGGGGTSHIPR